MTPPVQSPVSLRTLLDEVIERDASDLHITAGDRPKLRVDGDIINSTTEHVLTPENIKALYDVEADVHVNSATGHMTVVPVRRTSRPSFGKASDFAKPTSDRPEDK